MQNEYKKYTKLNFEELDIPRYWHHHEEMAARAKKLGFKYISEAMCHLYYACGYSANDVGELFNVSRNCILYRLKSWGLKIRVQGGCTHYNKTFPYIKLIIKTANEWTGKKKDLYTFLAKECNLAEETIESFLRGETWKEYRN